MELMDKLEPVGRLFYVVSPNRTTFERLHQVPNYIESAVPDIFTLFLLEVCISIFLRRPNVRVNDTIACLSQGIIFQIFRIFAPGGQLVTYYYVYSNWRIINLPWNSLFTWWTCFFFVDFVYYWVHRAAHEVNFLWATHQVHHSSEDFNISTNVRQSVLQHLYLWIQYLPLALIIPPSVFIVHIQFTYIYQFWIHTDLIKTLGPLEYILNTPSHHRVHHGANRSCIDKNFGGTLIIWDRLFGSFAKESDDIVYGLTQPVNSFEPTYIQFNHCVHMWRMFCQCKGVRNKLSVLFKGPGWSPGKPRLGDPKDIPDIKAPARKHDTQLPGWCKMYIILHFLLLIQGYLTIMKTYQNLPVAVLYGAVAYEFFSLFSIGILLDKRLDSHKIYLYCDKACKAVSAMITQNRRNWLVVGSQEMDILKTFKNNSRDSHVKYLSCLLSPWTELLRCILFFILDSYLQSLSSISLTLIYARWIPEVMVRSTLVATIVFWIICCFIYQKFKLQKSECETIEMNKMV